MQSEMVQVPAAIVETEEQVKAALQVAVTAYAERVASYARAYADEGPGVLEVAKGLEVRSPETYAIAAEACAVVKARSKAADEQRKAWTGPLDKAKKLIDKAFHAGSDAFASAEKALKDKLAAWDTAERAREAAAREKLAAAAAAGNHVEAAAALDSLGELGPVKVAGLSFSEVWGGEVVDAALIPREYLIPDVARLTAITKAAKADPGIPGWRATMERRAAVRGAA